MTAPACQQPLPAARVLCACGHPETSHEINRSGARTYCCHYSPAGPCPCSAFTQPMPGDHVADLADGSGDVHAAGCSAAAPRADPNTRARV